MNMSFDAFKTLYKAIQGFRLEKSRETEEAIFKWQQTALNDPFLKLQKGFLKLDQLREDSICLNFLFTHESPLPIYSDIEEFRLFCQTRHPKHLLELVKRECQQLDNFIGHIDDFKSLKYPTLLFVLPDRFDHLIKWWEGLQLYVNKYDTPIRLIKTGEVGRFGEEVKQLRERILRVKRGVENIKIGRPKKNTT
jgi:hypothetical protein